MMLYENHKKHFVQMNFRNILYCHMHIMYRNFVVFLYGIVEGVVHVGMQPGKKNKGVWGKLVF